MRSKECKRTPYQTLDVLAKEKHMTAKSNTVIGYKLVHKISWRRMLGYLEVNGIASLNRDKVEGKITFKKLVE